ncbi:MAG: NAD(P)-dependent oxidoreductase [Bacteroidota bacterium]|jgi:GDP-L-fucose synthase
MYLNNKNIFLAGSTGLAGTAIIEWLLRYHPSIKIRAAYHYTEPFIRDGRITYVQGDLSSLSECKRMVSGCDCAIMAAARTSGATVLTEQPWQQITENVVMNTVMLQTFFEEGIKRVVYISSASLYQELEGYIKEKDLDLNKEPYAAYMGIGWVTRFTEKLCTFWHQQGMEIVIARAANIFGPYARFDPATSNFIPALIRKAVDKMDPFEVWGHPAVTRDVVYVDDFAKAVIMMLDNSNIQFDVFNIGSGVKTTVGDVVQWALQYSGHNPTRIVYNEQSPSTVPSRVLDNSKAKAMLGWDLEYSVAEGIGKTVAWWKENHKRWIR